MCVCICMSVYVCVCVYTRECVYKTNSICIPTFEL